MRIRPVAADVLVALAQTCVAVLLGREASSQEQPPLDLAGYALAVIINMACAFRSKAPVESASLPSRRGRSTSRWGTGRSSARTAG